MEIVISRLLYFLEDGFNFMEVKHGLFGKVLTSLIVNFFLRHFLTGAMTGCSIIGSRHIPNENQEGGEPDWKGFVVGNNMRRDSLRSLNTRNNLSIARRIKTNLSSGNFMQRLSRISSLGDTGFGFG